MERRALVIAAFAVVYLVWGSTYLGIDIAIETMPPLAMAATRFAVASFILFIWARGQGDAWPEGRDVLDAAVVGLLMLTGGNGALSVAETKMPIGVAALLIATVPMWMVGLDAIASRRLPRMGVLAGLAVGLVGVALLAGVDAGWDGGADPWFVLLILAGSASWAIGSLRSRKSRIAGMKMRVAMQMAGGAVGLAIGSAMLEPTPDIGAISARSAWALVYLITFGSVLAFTAYIWLLRTVSAAAVGTYAFVNPLVALALGVVFLDEPIVARSAIAGALIVAAVIVINRAEARATVRDGEPSTSSEQESAQVPNRPDDHTPPPAQARP